MYRHPRTGGYYFRRRVPDRLRPILGKTEVRISLETKNHDDAKRRYPAVAAEVQRRFDSAGQTVTLTNAQIHGLAADWLRDSLAALEGDPPDDGGIDAALDLHQTADERGAHERVLDDLYGGGMVAALLRSRGLENISPASRGLLVDRLFWNSVELWNTLRNRLRGDYTVPVRLQQAPAYTPVAPARPLAAVPLLDLLDGWAAERNPRAKTRKSWRSRVDAFVEFLGHDDAARVSAEDAVNWKAELLRRSLAATTINDGHLAALRSMFAYGVRNRRLSANPFAGINVGQRRSRGRASKRQPFSDDDAALLLRTARNLRGWQRWVPLLLAYTGARLEEVAGAAAADVGNEGGIPYIDIHAELRELKNESSERRVPLHPEIVREGFLEYVAGLKMGSPLFPDVEPDKYGRRSSAMSKWLGRWIRRLGITDRRKVGAHSWRHRFTDLCRAHGIPRDVRFALEGHTSGDEGDEYGTGFPLSVLAQEISKLPVQCPSAGA